LIKPGTFFCGRLSNESENTQKGGRAMLKKISWTVWLMVLMIPAWACAHSRTGNVVDMRIVSDSGKEFAKYKTYPRIRQESNFFFVEAVKGDRYSIQVTNKSGRRIGVVIAVDGRNIISGKKSDLKRDERMYILNAYESSTFEGWRTSMERTNRFYFTEPSDSYAEKVFSDASAMGTIALVVYREKLPEIIPYSGKLSRMPEAPAGAAPQAPSGAGSTDHAERKKNEEAGTGFGDTTYSPAHVVHFEPEKTPAEKIVLKYEWRAELCRKRIIPCGPKNRFWPDDHEFAPVPHDFKG
jgi:hypothetical protein